MIKRSTRAILSLPVFAVLASCVVGLDGAYYEPSYPDKTAALERRFCGGQAGPLSVIKLSEKDGISIKARLETDKEDKLRLGISINVPRGSKAKFVSDEIQLSDSKSGRRWSIKPYFRIYESMLLVPSATVSVDEVASGDIRWTNLKVSVPFSISNYFPRAVAIDLPPIIVNGETYVIPSIQLEEDKEFKEKQRIEAFEKKLWWGPTYEERKRWWWWLYKAKDENKNGTWGKTGDFIVGGGITAGYLDNEFGGNITVSFPPTTKWSFSSNSIRIVDLDTGEERHINFKKMRLEVKLNLALTALVSGTAAYFDPGSEPVISEHPLDSLVVELPNLIVNGEEIPIKPITFDKRSFRIGIEPFNC